MVIPPLPNNQRQMLIFNLSYADNLFPGSIIFDPCARSIQLSRWGRVDSQRQHLRDAGPLIRYQGPVGARTGQPLDVEPEDIAQGDAAIQHQHRNTEMRCFGL